MGNQDEQFCLKWNDFQQCIKSTFQELREEKDFMDVTLCCDGEQLRAHKVILSACSLTFRNLLKKNPSQNPVILLWDVSPRDLSAILDFMYNGEVNVKQDHLNSFLSVAERLRVRGLCQSDSKSSKDNRPRSRPAEGGGGTEPDPRPAKRSKYSGGEDADIEEILPSPAAAVVKQEPALPATPGYSAAPALAAAAAHPVQVAGEDFGEEYTEEEYGEYYEDEASYGVDPVDQSQQGKGLSCDECGKQFSRGDVLKTHIRDLHLNAGITFGCDVCGKPAKSLNALKVHTSIYHRNVRKPDLN